jgi:hypothetical protein
MQGKEEISLSRALKEYYYHYKPKAIKIQEEKKYRRKLVFFVVLVLSVSAVYYLYKK